MKFPDIPANECERLGFLTELAILDTPPESRYDKITREAKAFFGVPVALVSLIDADRQWFKSCDGLDVSETGRDISFCGHAINHDEILYVPNTEEDLRFRTNPLVEGEPYIRFYAGAPLIMRPDLRIGTLCIIDRVSREFDEEQLVVLRRLADKIQDELLAVMESKN